MITEKFRLNSDREMNRYDIAKFLNPIQDCFWDILDSEFISSLIMVKKYNYYTVTTEEGRPDLIAERIYGLGNSQFWWIIMILNNYVLPSDIKNGDNVKYLSTSVLETLYFSLLNDSSSGSLKNQTIEEILT